MVERVSSYGLGQSMVQSSLALQARYAGATGQQASGLVAESYGDLGSKASTLISLESSTSRLQTWSDTTQIANDRIQAMYSSIGDMVDQLTAFRTNLSAALSSNGNDVDLKATGQSMLSDLGDLMNLRQDGRYLFAGSRTDTAPVDVSALTAPNTPSVADSAYYQGDTATTSVRISEQQSIDYSVTADGTAFEKALRAANVIANATTVPVNDTDITEAYDLATEAMDGLLAIQSKLSINSSRLETAQTHQAGALELLGNMTSDLKSVDAAQLTVKLTQYETQLQASYSALAKISELNLTKYL